MFKIFVFLLGGSESYRRLKNKILFVSQALTNTLAEESVSPKINYDLIAEPNM